MADLNTDIRFIKGVGETRARALEKLHIRTLGDLISYYPRRWEDRTKLFPIRDLPEGEYACCRAMLAQEPTAHRISGGQTVVKVRAVDEGGVLDITFSIRNTAKTPSTGARRISSTAEPRAAASAAGWPTPCWKRRAVSS